MAALTLNDQQSEVRVLRYRPRLEVLVDGRAHGVEPLPTDSPTAVRLRIDGREVQGWCAQDGDMVHLRINGRSHVLLAQALIGGSAPADRSRNDVCADLPGKLVSLHCAQEDKVRSGDLLMRIESMKMEVSLVAPRDGVIERLLVESGQSFERGTPLLRLVKPSQD